MRLKKQINIEIGERIKAAREAASLTQEIFSERIEVTPQYVSDLERGVVGVSLSTLKRICVILGVSADSILFGTPPSARTEQLVKYCTDLSEEQFDILLGMVSLFVRGIRTK